MQKRLDIYLSENNTVKSRSLAASLIKQGSVEVNGRICTKASFAVDENDNIRIIGEMPKYVGRGGLKLEKALSHYRLHLDGSVCIDIGASTGGFTDCMLQNGAAKVYCVDVGYGQLAWKIRSDERVVNMERTNIRYVTPDMIPGGAVFALGGIKKLTKQMDYREVGGSPLLGAAKPVFKAHGSSDAVAFCNAIRQAKEFVEKDVNSEIMATLAAMNEKEMV